MTSALPPLRFERQALEKVWGGRALERNPGIDLPPQVLIGETWEVVDRAEENSVVAEGPLIGRSLRQLMEEHADEILGAVPPNAKGRFPLLVKYIDASDNLSVQVHPDDATATRIGQGAEGKTEAWYVLAVAEKGAVYAGLKPEVTREHFAKVAQTPDVVDCLQRLEVQPGDCVLVPGGTVHAIGAGVTVAEVQQNSDTTYRIWDWGRPRETHLEQALACTRFGASEDLLVRPDWREVQPGLLRATLARSDFFRADSLELSSRTALETGGRVRMYAVIDGSARCSVPAQGVEQTWSRGEVWLVPASVGEHLLEPVERSVSVVLLGA